MSSDSFRLESFRPWNPFQDKARPLRDSLDICRYPSPVSITETSPPSNFSNSATTNPNVHSHKPERHPLPPRPPVQVCLNDNLSQEVNTQSQDATEHQSLRVDRGFGAFDFEEILQPQALPSSGDENHLIIHDQLDMAAQHPLGFESGDPELACTASQDSHADNTASSLLTIECCDATIDPAIVDDFHFRDIEQTPARKETSDAMAARSSNKTVRGRSKRLNSQNAMKPRQQRSQTGRSTRANGPVKMSFSVLRDQFSSLPVEEQLQFLSWLFQGALSQCLHTSTSTDGASALGFIGEGPSTPPVQLLPDANLVDIEHPSTTRKGLSSSAEEDRLLGKLRQEENLTWSEVIERFSQRFPGRSKGSIQVHWSTKLRKQLPS